MALVGVPAMVIHDVWHCVEPYLQRALEEVEEYRFDVEYFRKKLEWGEAQLWVREKPFDIVVVTEIYDHDKAKELSIGPISGNLGDTWEKELAQLEAWGRSQGCTHVGTLGRPGWERKLGWRKFATYVVKELGEGE